ncbi:MAG: hypothetical protein IT435_01940 [Phycisphaerales bacterium]|nr:hypothetical protein [Phycisphaerales bacterium]
MRSSPSRTRRIRILTLACALGLSAPAILCAIAAPQPDSPGPQASDPISALRDAARRELDQPISIRIVNPPPGIDADAVRPIDPSSPDAAQAQQTLDQVLADLAHKSPVEARLPEEPPAPAVRAQALRIYAQGRARAADNQFVAAIADFELVTRLDPSSVRAWRELGDAQLAGGRRLAAISSYLQAAQRGSDDPRIWWMIGRDALRSAKPEQAAGMLARAHTLAANASDPAIEFLISADLGESLLKLGHLRAGITSLSHGLLLPTPLPWTTRQRTEVIDLVRRRAELNRDAGDAAVRIGAIDDAMALYQLADDDEQLDPSELLLRRVHALRTAGRPAATAALIVDEIAAQPIPVTDTQITLIKQLAADGANPDLLPDAIDSLIASTRLSGPTAARQWARAAAAPIPTQQSRERLRTFLVNSQPAEQAFDDLLATYPRNDAPARIAEFLQLVNQSGRALPLIDRLMATTSDAEGELTVLQQDPSETAAIVRIGWLLRMGRITEAADAAESLKSDRAPALAAAARIEAFTAAGRFPAIEPQLKIIREHATPRERFLLPRALAHCQRFTEAFNALPLPGPDADSLTPDETLDSAGIAVRAGSPLAAETILLRMLHADAFEERGYEALAALYAPSSPINDENKLSQTIRIMRQACPSGRTLRWLTAQELALRKLDAQAQAILLGLVEDGVVSDSIISVLASTLQHRIAAEPAFAAHAETLVRRLIARYPETPALYEGLANVLAAAGKAQEGDDELARQLARRPWSQLAEGRESFIREILKKPEAASKMALTRLAPAPRSIPNTISYAVQLIRDSNLDQAAQVLTTDLPPAAAFTPDQQTRLAGAVAAQFEPADRAGASPTLRRKQDSAAIVSLFDVLAQRGGPMAPQMHQARITMLAAIPGVDPNSVAAACEKAGRDVPGIASAAFMLGAQEITRQSKKTAHALVVLRKALAVVKEPNDPLLNIFILAVCEAGADSDIAHIDTTLGNLDRQRQALKLLDPDTTPPTADAQVTPELFYIISQQCSFSRRRDLAEVALRRTLELDPDHGLANNDLGYMYVEDGRELETASRLLERAYRIRPQSANVIDSLAWLRYQQGRLEDNPAAPGAEPQLGAVTLMAKASQAEGGMDNHTIQDHLGDAMWRVGRRADAQEAWRRAKSLIESLFARIDPSRTPPDRLQELRDDLESITAKLAALERGDVPAVAAMKWAPPADK